jgi:DNA-binding MarR family transcriptional regulator
VDDQADAEAARASAVAADLRLLITRLLRRLREEETQLGDCTPSQLAVLSRLERAGPATVTTLARAEGVRPQSMGASVAALEAAGYVSGTPDPSDGRQTILSVTAAAREKIRASRATREGWLFRAIRTNLSSAEQDQLATGVDLLKRLLNS